MLVSKIVTQKVPSACGYNYSVANNDAALRPNNKQNDRVLLTLDSVPGLQVR